MLINILTLILGVFFTLFIFWKRLRDDYASGIIFNSLFIIFAVFFASYLISSNFFPGWFFWIELAGVSIGLAIAVYRNKIRFYESLEALIFSFLPWVALTFLKDSVKNLSLFSFVAFAVMLVLIFVFYFVDTHYKNFTWYKSGKIGLSGLAVLFLFFLIRSAIAIFFPSVLSFSGNIEPYLSGIFALISLVMIFNLGKVEK